MFSIQTDINGNKYVNVDTDQNIFDDINSKDYNRIAKMYINDYLLGNTRLSDTGEAVIDTKSARKYTNPGKRQSNFIEKMKLTPELRNALEISKKTQVALPSKETSKYKSWGYYKFNFKLDNQNFSGVINIGIDSQGNRHFYEINNIKKTSGISETSPNRPTGFSVNNIPQSTQSVNSSTSTRYSMQENQNDAQNTSQPTNSLYKDAEIEQKVKSIVTSPAMRRQMYQDIDNYIEDY